MKPLEVEQFFLDEKDAFSLFFWYNEAEEMTKKANKKKSK
jgi:hypothetical protein